MTKKDSSLPRIKDRPGMLPGKEALDFLAGATSPATNSKQERVEDDTMAREEPRRDPQPEEAMTDKSLEQTQPGEANPSQSGKAKPAQARRGTVEDGHGASISSMGDEFHCVIFRLVNEYYAVDISHARTIIPFQPVTRVPHTPDFVEGVINNRGQVVPVVDLRKRFALAKKDADIEAKIIVMVVGKDTVGMIVDAVTDVIKIPRSKIEPTPPVMNNIEAQYIAGIANLDDTLVVLLRMDRVLTEGEMKALEEAGFEEAINTD